MPKHSRCNLPELPTTTSVIVICGMSKGNDIAISAKPLEASFTDARHWEAMIDFIDKNESPKKPYSLMLMFKCSLVQDELDEEYIGLYTPGLILDNDLFGQVSYYFCLSNVVKLKLGHNPKIVLVEKKRARRKVIGKHVIGPVKVLPTNRIKARCVQLRIIINTLWKVLKRVEERRERRMVGKRMILELM